MKPSTKYQMMLMGEMRPVIKMYRGPAEVTDPTQATTVVLYFADDDWVVTPVTHPGDITLAPRSREGKTWETIR